MAAAKRATLTIRFYARLSRLLAIRIMNAPGAEAWGYDSDCPIDDTCHQRTFQIR
jgi:hypothetical protein